jgi:hypothetical protein
MKWNNFVKYLAIAAITVGTIVPSVLASDKEKEADGFYLVPKSHKVCDWVSKSVPLTLTNAEVQSLKDGTEVGIMRDIPQRNQTRKLHFKTCDPTSNGTSLTSNLRGDWRFVTNWLKSEKDAAKLVSVETINGDDPSNFFAIYQLVSNPNIQFTMEGRLPELKGSIVRITDIDEEAKDESPRSLVRLDNPLIPQLSLASHEFQLLFQQTMMQAALENLDIGAQLPQESSALHDALMHAGKHIFSFVTKPMLKKLPGMNVLHPQVELFAKTMGYSTVTHMLVDVMQNGKLNSKLLETEQSTAIIPSERTSQRLHATSRTLGYAVSYLPGGTAMRTIMTYHVNRQGYATLTHWAMGMKDLDPSEVADLYTPERLGQEGVALAVETLVPFGNVMVAVSQTGARLFLNEPSVTAFVIKKIRNQAGKEKQT